MNDPRAAVDREFQRVNDLIVEQLRSDVELVENIGNYIVEGGGKRLRPLLALLSAAALGGCREPHIRFAAVVEFIHTATLLHDDVVDLSELRRGRPTANAAFGNAPSVLVGDFIYTRAFQLMVAIGDLGLLHQMAETTNMIAAGEVLQLMRAGDPETTEAQYLDVITRKTAILFAAACSGAARLHGSDDELREGLHDYGLHLGIAFQMIDDVLDYEGDPAITGKNIGDDLAEGKPTLPLIRTMSVVGPAERDLIADAIRRKDASRRDEVMAIVQSAKGVGYTRARAEEHRDTALAALRRLPESEARDTLTALAAASTRRDR